MILNANLDLVVYEKDRESKRVKQIPMQDQYEFELDKTYGDRFLKAADEKTKARIIQGFLQTPKFDKMLAERLNTKEKAYFRKTLVVLNYSQGALDSQKEEVDVPTPKKKRSKKVL